MRNINQNEGQPIHRLITILDDAKKGYLNAAEKIKDEVLSLLFENFACQKSRYSNELRQLVNRFNFSSSIDQFTLSLLYRTWMDLKATFKLGEKENIIQACIKGEETALENYTAAINQIQNNYEVKVVLEQQVNGIRTVLNTIKEYTGKTGM